MPTTTGVTTRPATEADEAYLYDLYGAVRGPEFALLPLPEEQRQLLVRQQYEWQSASYQAAFPQSNYELVLSGATVVGRVWVSRSPGWLHLVDIAIHPTFQRQGIARALLQKLQQEAAQVRAAVRSTVLRFNLPSVRLHEQAGFCIEAESEMELEMVWRQD